MMSSLQQLEHALAPWQSTYNNSKLLSTSIAGMHLVALLFGGGFAVAADRTTLRAMRASATERTHQLGELHSVHRPVLIWLAISFASGLVLTAADLRTFVDSPAFWIKLIFIALLVVNGAVLTHTESRLRRAGVQANLSPAPLWSRLRVATLCSLALWTATLLVSVVLQSAS